eukprot:11829728-Prorocentrum_lima.AAC.1
MTSSLVGSEMCIRDRSSKGRQPIIPQVRSCAAACAVIRNRTCSGPLIICLLYTSDAADDM